MLCCHAGAKVSDLNELSAIPLPEETETYTPLPHMRFIEMVQSGLGEFGYEVTGQEYAISKETKGVDYGHQMFGTLTLRHENADFATCLGLRNSYDKSLAAGVCVGSKVFVCDNLAFIGDFMALRKHTANILADLPKRISDLLANVPALIAFQDEQLQSYRAVELTNTLFNDFAVRGALAGVYSGDKIMKVVKEWREPRHPEFAERTLWSGINCVTEVLKGSNIFDLQQKTQRLYEVAGEYV